MVCKWYQKLRTMKAVCGKRTKQPTCFYGPRQSGDDKTEVAAAAVERDR